MLHQVDDTQRWVLYGATGFTGRLILARSLDLGLRPVVAGRSPDKVAELAQAHGLEHAAASVADADALTRMLTGKSLVLNAAGPFGETAVPVMEACLRTGTRYADIGGDVSVLQKQLILAEAFRQAGITAVLAVGFDVVPTDYAAKWAAFMKGSEPVDEIQLGLSLPVSMSRGSLRALVDDLHRGTLILRQGVLQRVRPLAHTAVFDYGRGPAMSLANTWGDLLTAPLTTGIQNVAVYFEATPPVRQAARLSELLAWPAKWKGVRSLLKLLVRFLPEGPDDQLRASQQATIVAHSLRRGEVVRKVRIHTGDPYQFTASSAAKAVGRLLAAPQLAGMHSPASVLGDDFLDGLPGVVIEPALQDGVDKGQFAVQTLVQALDQAGAEDNFRPRQGDIKFSGQSWRGHRSIIKQPPQNSNSKCGITPLQTHAVQGFPPCPYGPGSLELPRRPSYS